jgi:hypothetical protein
MKKKKRNLFNKELWRFINFINLNTFGDDKISTLTYLSNSRMKVDFDTPLESFFTQWIVFFIGFFAIFVFDSIDSLSDSFLWKTLGIFAFVVIFFYVFRRLTNNYYILDKKNRQVKFHREFFFFTAKSSRCSFNDVFCIIPRGRRRYRPGDITWEYALSILLKKGRFIHLGNTLEYTDINKKDLASCGKEIADYLGISYIHIKRNQQVRVVHRPVVSKKDLEYIADWKLDLVHYSKLFLVLTGIMVCLLIILRKIYIIYH